MSDRINPIFKTMAENYKRREKNNLKKIKPSFEKEWNKACKFHDYNWIVTAKITE